MKFDDLPDNAVVKLEEVLRLTGYSRSAWYRGQADGTLPEPVKRPGSRANHWYVGEIRKLLAELKALPPAQAPEPGTHYGSAEEQGLKPARPKVVKRKDDLL